MRAQIGVYSMLPERYPKSEYKLILNNPIKSFYRGLIKSDVLDFHLIARVGFSFGFDFALFV